MAMPDKNEDSTTWRGDVMRRMAAIHAELSSLRRAKVPTKDRDTRIQELKKQLADLMKKFLA
jgi:hypothetical protein